MAVDEDGKVEIMIFLRKQYQNSSRHVNTSVFSSVKHLQDTHQL